MSSLVCFPSDFKLSFCFKQIIITGYYTECLTGIVYGRKGSQNFNQ